MRRTTISVVVCLLLSVAVQAQRASNTTALETALQNKLDEWHKAGSFPGATLGVVLANGETLSLAVGFSDRETKVFATAERESDHGAAVDESGRVLVEMMEVIASQQRQLGSR